jgi:Uma2 family endonuclease
MATASIKSIREVDCDQCVELHDIGWKGYSTLLRLKGDRSAPRIVYLDGTVWIMSPALLHERLKKRMGWLVEVIGEELDIPFIAADSTTLRRKAKRGGVEGDESYYLKSAERVRGQKKLDLKVDPPPDLAIEVDYAHAADAAVEVYRRFKVPELWVCNESELVILILEPNRRYARSDTSLAFPFVSALELYDWVNRSLTMADKDWIKELRLWVKKTLAPRSGRPTAGSQIDVSQQGSGEGHSKN